MDEWLVVAGVTVPLTVALAGAIWWPVVGGIGKSAMRPVTGFVAKGKPSPWPSW